MSAKSTAAVGVFDGVHLGHQELVREVRAEADKSGSSATIFTFSSHPLLAIAPDRVPPTLTPAPQKEALLMQAGADRVVTLDFNDSLRMMPAREFMRLLHDTYGVERLVMGFNHRFGHDKATGFDHYAAAGKETGIDVLRGHEKKIEGVDCPVSSSSVRRCLLEGNIDTANAMLGHEYSIIGTVDRGQQIGREIGFPTANLRPACATQLIPKGGVYAAIACIGGKEWPAMVNIGCRPTIGAGLSPTIEAHIIGLDDDLYGRELEVRFAKRVRDEKKFDDLEHLRRQLEHDKHEISALITRR